MATNLLNPRFETAPSFTAVQTGDGWIDGTATGSASNAASAWWASPRATAIAVRFDPTKARSGSFSLKVSTTNTSGRARVFTVPASGGNITAATHPNWIAVIPGSTYILTGYVQTSNVAAGGAFLEIVEANSSFTIGTSTASNTASGTNTTTWTLLTATVTVGASTTWLAVDCQNAVAGNISDAWFEDLVISGPGISGGSGFFSLMG